MSFKTIFGDVLTTILGLQRIVAPIVSILVPGSGPAFAALDPLFRNLIQSITDAEAQSPESGTGPAKAQMVQDSFDDNLAFAQSIAATSGIVIVYDKDQLRIARDSQVAAFNAMALVKASLKMVPVNPVKG